LNIPGSMGSAEENKESLIESRRHQGDSIMPLKGHRRGEGAHANGTREKRRLCSQKKKKNTHHTQKTPHKWNRLTKGTCPQSKKSLERGASSIPQSERRKRAPPKPCGCMREAKIEREKLRTPKRGRGLTKKGYIGGEQLTGSSEKRNRFCKK